MAKSVLIIDYGMGNLQSVVNAFIAVGCEPRVSNEPGDLRSAERLVLPGVGAFGDGMANLRAAGWVDSLEEEVRGKGKPLLGLCLGMQLLASTSTEHGVHTGLGWIPGPVERIPDDDPTVRIPHIGWNDVRAIKRDGLYAGLEASQTFYFVHSYVFRPVDERVVSGLCEYGGEFAASVEFENICATQFHPEKSHQAGLKLLENFSFCCPR